VRSRPRPHLSRRWSGAALRLRATTPASVSATPSSGARSMRTKELARRPWPRAGQNPPLHVVGGRVVAGAGRLLAGYEHHPRDHPPLGRLGAGDEPPWRFTRWSSTIAVTVTTAVSTARGDLAPAGRRSGSRAHPPGSPRLELRLRAAGGGAWRRQA
jgi:hypothetical protein